MFAEIIAILAYGPCLFSSPIIKKVIGVLVVPCILHSMMVQCFTVYADMFLSNKFVVITKK